jgi:hypothetical protein
MVSKVVNVFFISSKLRFQIFRDILTINGEGILLLVIENLAEWLSQKVVDFPVTEEQIVSRK